MVINMDENQLRTIKQIEAFLAGGAAVEFTATGDDGERYAFIARTLSRFYYPGRGKRERGVLRRYLAHVSWPTAFHATRVA